MIIWYKHTFKQRRIMFPCEIQNEYPINTKFNWFLSTSGISTSSVLECTYYLDFFTMWLIFCSIFVFQFFFISVVIHILHLSRSVSTYLLLFLMHCIVHNTGIDINMKCLNRWWSHDWSEPVKCCLNLSRGQKKSGIQMKQKIKQSFI